MGVSQVRDFVRSALYDPNHGYFSKRAGPVGLLDASIRFNQLEGGLLCLLISSALFLHCILYEEFGVCSGITGMNYGCFLFVRRVRISTNSLCACGIWDLVVVF
jgi:hypothetical protein